MYLSQLILNIRSRDVVRDQNNPYELHRSIMRAFPVFDHEKERVLFRLEGEHFNKLLVQSTLQPDWHPLSDEGNYLTQPPAIKNFGKLKFLPGQFLRFQLRANPIRRDAISGKRLALLKENERIAWLQRKGSQNGFYTDESMAASQSSKWCQFNISRNTGKKRATLNIVDFQGALRVIDPALLNMAIQNGIGPAKGLGCGLLSLAPARQRI